MRRFEVTMTVYATVTINDETVLDRVTGPEGDEWRSQFYDFYSAEEVAEHLVFNAATNGVHDVRRLDGWADVADEDAAIIEIDDTETSAVELPT